MNKHLEDVFELVRQEAKRGGFRLRYLADGTIDIIHSLRERLSALGYAVESHAADKVDFVIYWK
ncbi:MAG: hypothetical protein LBQ58_10645 [Synergistaceae bacterium]|nr:hypothetical protein [Synergistaceae bacterium]